MIPPVTGFYWLTASGCTSSRGTMLTKYFYNTLLNGSYFSICFYPNARDTFSSGSMTREWLVIPKFLKMSSMAKEAGQFRGGVKATNEGYASRDL